MKTAVAAAGLGAVTLSPAFAQDATTDTDTQQDTEMQQMAYSEEKLESFVDAAMEVQTLMESYTPRVQAAETEAEQQALAEEANTEIRDAISESEGITLEEYVEIGEAAQADPALAQRITAMAQERAEEQPEG
jgi:hypothetical protein